MNITLRPVSESDEPFLLELYAGARAAEMELVPWTDAQKRAFLQMQFAAQKSSYSKEYPEAQHLVICRDSELVGRLYVAHGANRTHILDITISVQHRNAGIGSFVIAETLREADRAGRRTTIHLDSFSPSIRLFERLGFRATEVKGFHVLLERFPAPLKEPVSEGRSARSPECG